MLLALLATVPAWAQNVSPPNQSATTAVQPTISAAFPDRVHQPRIWIDGTEFTHYLRTQGNTVTLVPPYNLDFGTHQVRMQNNDQQLAWSFAIVNPNGSQAYNPGYNNAGYGNVSYSNGSYSNQGYYNPGNTTQCPSNGQAYYPASANTGYSNGGYSNTGAYYPGYSNGGYSNSGAYYPVNQPAYSGNHGNGQGYYPAPGANGQSGNCSTDNGQSRDRGNGNRGYSNRGNANRGSDRDWRRNDFGAE